MADGRELVPLHTGFDVVLRGYRRGPVRQYVQSVEEELRVLAADRDANASLAEDLTREVERLRAENSRLVRRIEHLNRAPVDPERLPARLRQMVELAKEEAGEIIARAQAAAEHCRATASEDADRLRTAHEERLADLDRRRQEMESEHEALMREAKAEVAELMAEAERQREQVESDFEVAMAARRAEAVQEIATRRRAAKTEAENLIATAKAEATRRVTEATRKAERTLTAASAESTRRLAEAKINATRLVEAARAEADRRRAEATTLADRLVTEATTEADRRRTDATSTAEKLIDEATTRADHLLADATAQAGHLVAEATSEADRRVGVARRRVDELRELRSQLAAHIRTTREVLAGAAPLLQPDDQDDPDPGPRPADIPAQRNRPEQAATSTQ